MTSSDFLTHCGVTALLITGCYLIYKLLLKKETDFRVNRHFILLSLLLAVLLPFVHFDFVPVEAVLWEELDLAAYRDFFQPAHITTPLPAPAASSMDLFSLLEVLYWLGVGLFGVRFGQKIGSILFLIKRGETLKIGQYTYQILPTTIRPFAFLHYIVMDRTTFESADPSIHWHEQGHVTHRHTIDLLLLELILIFQWFNPFIYLFKRHLITVHEYQADASVIQRGVPITTYQQLLLDSVHSPSTTFASPFHNSQLKNRILMVNHYPFHPISFTKRIALIALIGLLCAGYACTELKSDLSPYTASLTSNTSPTPPSKEMAVVVAITEDAPTFISPVNEGEIKKIASGYGMRMHPVLKQKRFHGGIDIVAPMGTEVYAAADGIVKIARMFENWGNRITLQHSGGFSTEYAHMKSLAVQPDQHVQQGEVIGYVGNSGMSMGPHLHFEILKDGKRVNPEGYLEK